VESLWRYCIYYTGPHSRVHHLPGFSTPAQLNPTIMQDISTLPWPLRSLGQTDRSSQVSNSNEPIPNSRSSGGRNLGFSQILENPDTSPHHLLTCLFASSKTLPTQRALTYFFPGSPTVPGRFFGFLRARIGGVQVP